MTLKLNQLDIKTHKTLTLTGNFHPNCDVERLYMSQANGGGGLKCIKNLFESSTFNSQNSTQNIVKCYVNKNQLKKFTKNYWEITTQTLKL